jgi:hypothetical protein
MFSEELAGVADGLMGLGDGVPRHAGTGLSGIASRTAKSPNEKGGPLLHH